MAYCRLVFSLALASIIFSGLPALAEPLQHNMQLKAGIYLPASKEFDVGNGIDLLYTVQPLPYAALEAGIGYYRADVCSHCKPEYSEYEASYISAIPFTLSARAILPLPYINIYAGGGGGAYYKMTQTVRRASGDAPGLTELPADHSEWSLGYHANAGIEFPTSSGVTLLLDAKYVLVDQGEFSTFHIKHDGTFVYGGFSMNF